MSEVSVMGSAGHPRSTAVPIPKTVDQIVEIITERVRRREPGYEPGAQLPTYKQLAEELGTPIASVNRAIRKLREAGVLVGIRGGAVYVAERQ